jgi:coenzyme F420-dependent glucose-6-phosphate dehydrogenase
MNEVPVGFDWTSASVRLARTTEAIQIIKMLWERSKKGKENEKNSFVNFNGHTSKSKVQDSVHLLLQKKYYYTWQQVEKKQP